MTLLILGLLVWSFAHWFKRLAPDARALMGERGQAIVALLLVTSIVLMVLGYRSAAPIDVWYPPSFMIHINNLLMLVAFWVFGSSAAKGAKAWPAYKTRHPQLLSVKIWALAHLLVNGDLASVVLFGGLLGWAAISVILINRAEPDWAPPAPAGRATYIRLIVISLVIFALVALVHNWLGYWPFPS
tara:strand:- start:2159 stop:2716 length:558 start_codon:yes stop_codon:yes gene_type:complete